MENKEALTVPDVDFETNKLIERYAATWQLSSTEALAEIVRGLDLILDVHLARHRG